LRSPDRARLARLGAGEYEFGEGNDFCKKVTYLAPEDPKATLADFRNAYNARIAVTVDMIATGTDVRPLECLLFMRDVRSSNYFEQMKGRGTRTMKADDLKKVTPSAQAKTHYVIVDAVGVTKSLKTASRPLDEKPSVSFRDLAMGVVMGVRDDATLSSLAPRLARLDKQLQPEERHRIEEKAGLPLASMVHNLFDAIDGDTIAAAATAATGEAQPDEAAMNAARDKLVNEAANVFNGPLVDLLENIRRDHEQTIDHDTLDALLSAEWAGDTTENAKTIVNDFADWLNANRDEIEALTIYFSQAARRSAVCDDLFPAGDAARRSSAPRAGLCLARLRPSRRCDVRSDYADPEYLEKAVNCGASRSYIEQRIRTTAGQAGISGADLKGMPVPVCGIAEQTEINRAVDSRLSVTKHLEAEIEVALAKITALRQSILKKAFSGQLVPQEPSDEPAAALLARIRAETADANSGRKGRRKQFA
jgi:hypothetical protein